jgi:polyferredoxin
MRIWDALTFLKEQEGEDSSGPSWKYRRKLIYGVYRLGFVMIIFGMGTFFLDREVSVQLVIGGVALISIILTAYTASATFEDVNLYKKEEEEC